MKILYIYRNPKKGFSIGKVMKPVEKKIAETEEVESFYLPRVGASFYDLMVNIIALFSFIKRKKYDLYHITGDCYYISLVLPKHKTITTVHDLGFYTNHRDLKIRSAVLYWFWIRPLLKNKAITFISDKTKEETEGLLTFADQILVVIPNVYSPDFHYSEKAFSYEKPVILHLGTKPNKNLDRVIEALSMVNCHLRIIGPIPPTTLTLLEQHKIEYSNDCNLTDQQIVQEYNNCDIVSFPSLYEGFGMMIIEGQAVGRAVVTSNVSPMKEIAGDSAIIVDPYSVLSIRQGFLDAIRNHQTYIRKGFENVKQYNINVIAKEYLDLYYS